MKTNKAVAILKKHASWVRDPSKGKRADLEGADLEGADLRGASLQRANMRGTVLEGAILQGAKGIISIYVPGVSTRGDYLFANDHGEKGWILYAGCWSGTIAEFRSRAADRPLYLSAANFIEEVTK